jgi:UDP-galactopyranose mutase
VGTLDEYYLYQMKSFLIVGAGFSGAVLARELADSLDRPIIVIDERSHVGGNCHTERDSSTDVLVHKYGPHVFHTNRKDVWSYIQQFDDFAPFINHVKASIPAGVFSLPINLHTINQFFGVRLGPEAARRLIKEKGDSSIRDAKNFEEEALRIMGRELYEAFFRGYTQKQWGCDPRELPTSLLKRLPFRFNYDENYYDSIYQGMPRSGYTAIVERILKHPRISIQLTTRFDQTRSEDHEAVFYTGSLDGYFGYSQGRLGYRTVFWKEQEVVGDYQGNAVINYPDIVDKHTRIIEYKHLMPWESHDRSIVCTEFSKETNKGDIPYYPKRLKGDLELLANYRALATQESRERNVFFLGRLATYRYLDMHQVIAEAIDFSKSFLRWRKSPEESWRPIFSDAIASVPDSKGG